MAKFKSHLVNMLQQHLTSCLKIRSVDRENVIFNDCSNAFNHISVYMKAIQSNVFSNTTGNISYSIYT